jgi:hypothetical protein
MSFSIEENARKLAELEDEWKELGPQRQIDFHCRFPNRERAEVYLAKAKQAGFLTSLVWVDRECQGVCSIVMAPDARQITEFYKTLAALTETYGPEDRGGATEAYDTAVYGWCYPPKEQVSFFLGADKKSTAWSAQKRASVLFEGKLVEDQLGHRWPGPRTSFDLVPTEFLRKAQTIPPLKPEPTASAFAQWVYSIYGTADGRDRDLNDGKEAEEEIWARRRAATSSNDTNFLRRSGMGWTLIHNGLHLQNAATITPLVAPHLRVRGEALRGSPDLMYSNREGAELLIVETKFSRQQIPRNLWPNVWAQLWCYAQFQPALDARNVTVIGEVWGERWARMPERKKYVFLRALVRRNPRARAFDRFFRRLFDIYSGLS